MKKLCLLFFLSFFCADMATTYFSAIFADENDSNDFFLEEITVTAQKREENQQKVPITMDVVSSESLRLSGKNDLDEILSGVSGAILSKGADGLRVSIRGVSDDGNSFKGQSMSMPTVAVNMDGVFSNRKDTGSGLFDIERVEVLYGPQSTLYSSNSPGGIVNVVTASPKLDKYEVSASLEYGSYELFHSESSVNLPIGNKVALRTAFTTSSRDGYLSNGGDDEESKAGRIKLLYQPNDDLSFSLTGEVSKTSNQGNAKVDEFEDQDDVDDPWVSEESLGIPNEENVKKIYGRVDWDLNFATMSLLPAYTNRDGNGENDTEAADGVLWTDANETSAEEKSVELRFSSPSEFFFKWIVGINYYNATDDRYTRTLDTTKYTHVVMEQEAKAIFANITYPISEKFRGTLGYRQSWDDLDYLDDEIRGEYPDGLEEAHVSSSAKYQDPDYKFGFEYDVSEESMVYADYTTSFRVQGMATNTPGATEEGQTPPAEELKAYQLGIKNRFYDNKLQMNVAAFYYDYKNYAATLNSIAYYGSLEELDLTASQMDPNSSTYGDGTMMGIDLKSTAVLSSKDVLNLSISFLKSEWDNLVFDYYYDYAIEGAPLGRPFTRDMIVEAETVSYNGKPMTSSPEWTINANYSHVFDLWNGGNIDAGIIVIYKSDYRLTWKDDDYPYNYQEPYVTTNLTATYNHPDGHWSLSTYVKNLTNYAEKRGYFGSPSGELMIGNPRTYGFVLSAHY